MPIRFGPAGLGPVKDAIKTLEYYHSLGLRSCEIAFTYSVYIKPEETQEIARKAKELDIELTIHAPYFVNLNSAEKNKIEATKLRILKCCEIGSLLGAKLVVFHPGYYGKSTKEETYNKVKQGILDIQKTIKEKNWKIALAPETMGKVNVFGSQKEIAQLVKDTGCEFCIDFAHVLAREKSVNYKEIESLFPQKNWHVHFSGIVYGEKGEKHHKTTEKLEWQNLLKNLPKNKNIRIINESPTHIEDAKEGLEIHKKIK